MTANFPQVDYATVAQLEPLSLAILSPPVNLGRLMVCSPHHVCHDSLFGLSNACSALKIVPMFPPTQLFPVATSLDPVEFPSATFSPTFQIPIISSTFDNLDTIARKTRAYL